MRVSISGTVVAVVISLCLGFAIGWWFRDLIRSPQRPTHTVVINELAERSPFPVSQPSPSAPTEPAQTNFSDEKILSQMLAAHQFREATALYYEVISLDSTKTPVLRPTVDDYLERCFETCDSNTFLALVETWLATFYDDIPALLLLARYQEHHGQPEAAANTLLMARTYALPAGDQRQVSKSLRQLTLSTDERLSEGQRWIELLGYYEYLAAIDFTTPDFELRRALLYLRLGEETRGSELLVNLLEADSGSDPQWTATLEQHLADATTEIAPSAEPSNAVPLERRGDGYLVEVTLDDQATLKLLVDTGASMTALTRDSFRRLYRPGFILLGTRLFNTANGYTRGEIYSAPALTLGEERLEDIAIAVLDFKTMDDIDGLLGMNVLRQFHFEIDQSAGAMHIKRR